MTQKDIYELLREHKITQVAISACTQYQQPNVKYYLDKHNNEPGSLPLDIALAIIELSGKKIDPNELGMAAGVPDEAKRRFHQLPIGLVGQIVEGCCIDYNQFSKML